MPFTETSPGHGTIAYRGEPPDYWWRKSALYRSRRNGLTVSLAVLGLVVLAFAAGPLARHHQDARVLARTPVSEQDPSAPATVLEVKVLHEGATGTETVLAGPQALTDPAYAPGRTVTVTTGGLGDTELGAQDVLWPWAFGGLLLAVAAGRVLHDRLRPGRMHVLR